MTINAYIFARQGSKGLPEKNKRVLDGIPLYAHSVMQAVKSGLFSSVYVSTDDLDIANTCFDYGAQLIIRPKQLATDDSPEWLSWRHAIDNSAHCDVFVSLPPTCPLRGQEDISGTVLALHGQTPMSVSVTECPANPYYVACTHDDDMYGLKRLFHGQSAPERRQAAPQVFNVVGVCYAGLPGYIQAHSSLWDCQPAAYLVPQERALDIDTAWDFHIAELVLRAKRASLDS